MSARHRSTSYGVPPYGYAESPISSAGDDADGTDDDDDVAADDVDDVDDVDSRLGRPQRPSVVIGGAAGRKRPRVQRLKACCRTTIAFMCTQVGVGGLIVVYALVGAASFISIETNANHSLTHDQHIDAVVRMRRGCADRLWSVAERHNVLANATWRRDVDALLRAYQTNMTDAIRLGYDGQTVQQKWTFPAALMFCLSVFSMIGYGNLVPRTPWGKGATMLYATFGIPLYILYFLNIGKVLAKSLRWAYARVYACTSDPDALDAASEEYAAAEAELIEYGPDGQLRVRGQPRPKKRRVIVPSTACLWVMTGYILIGTLMFAHWENWDYGDAVYFCVTSLCKIGMGDFVPGTTSNLTIAVLGYTIQDSSNQNQTKLVINFVYMLVGMGLVAMCYNLMREDVRCKCKEMKEDMALCMEDVRVRFSRCFGGGRSPAGTVPV